MLGANIMADRFISPAIDQRYLQDEATLISVLRDKTGLSETGREEIKHTALNLVETVRKDKKSRSPIDQLLQEYGLSTSEGVTLMRLAEALIRTPDSATSRALIRDKVGNAEWSAHAGKSSSVLVNQATNGLSLTSAWITHTGGHKAAHLLARLGDSVIKQAIHSAMGIMGDHFVLGRTIEQALERSRKAVAIGCTYSFDMLGEAALTREDAEAYFLAYRHAIERLAAHAKPDQSMHSAPGLSVKLSALHPRYEYAHREACVPVLVERLSELARAASAAGLWLNIDAEEADRLEVSLMIFERLLEDRQLADWPGLGLVVQAYQRRALPVIEHVTGLAAVARRKIAVRLVKGAYWDAEIKRAQELGLDSYPVFTRKENTDVSYLACASRLLQSQEIVFPQFATHNAHTAAAIMHMAGDLCDYEFQRLHGMGESLHKALVSRCGARSRIYAPVGSHNALLPYLVRRLLENGANSSFVNQLMNDEIPAAEIIADPVMVTGLNTSHTHPRIPEPRATVGLGRLSAKGLDLTQSTVAEKYEAVARSAAQYAVGSIIDGKSKSGMSPVIRYQPQDTRITVGSAVFATLNDVEDAVNLASQSSWHRATTPSERAGVLARAADLLEREMDGFLELCVREAGKTLPDSVAEVREAIDFCRYYALQAQDPKIVARSPLGVVACISPWNFPLAIFLGQIAAALSVGNTVVAKPAEQTPIIAARAVDLLLRAGLPASALQLLVGNGPELGAALTRHPSVAGVCFTGSTRTAKMIAASLATTGRAGAPLIAETGGINAMIVDSTALLEQAVKDVANSAFQSAGQRCSACRIVCVQDDIYEPFIQMLTGAMDEFVIGDPARLRTDVGPIIDGNARDAIECYKEAIRKSHRVLKECTLPRDCARGYFSAPFLVEVSSVKGVDREVFGPVLHIARFRAADLEKLVEDINSLGYGLTMGLHTRLDSRVESVASTAHVGNLYVNRNQIGAVVGVHPFGGESLSGTGPKAGGPHYLLGLTKAARLSQYVSNSRPRASNDTPPEGKTNTATLALAEAKRSSKDWSRLYSLDARIRLVRTALASIEGDYSGVLERLSYCEDLKLPGPTGEVNSLRLFPRGVVLCFGGDSPGDLICQVALVLTSGSSAIVAVADGHESAFRKAEQALRARGLLAGALVSVTVTEGLALLDANVDGVVADGMIRELVGSVSSCSRGPILPLLSHEDPIERFSCERTLTINTTAAGGNASLLALG